MDPFSAALAHAVALGDSQPDAFVSFFHGGISVPRDPALWTPAPTAALAMQLAAIADVIPPVNSAWRDDATRLSALYLEWLQRAVLPGAPVRAADAEALQKARADVAKLGERYAARRQQHDDIRQRLDTARREQRDPRTIFALQNELVRATQAWEAVGGKRAYETAKATIDHLTSRGLEAARQRLLADFERVSGAGSPEAPSPPIALTPTPLDARAIWVPSTLALSHASASTDPGVAFGGADLPALWSRRAGGAREPLPVDRAGMSLSFDWMRSAIDRSAWFDSMLPTSRSWWWAGATRAEPTAGGRLLSDGARPPATHGDWPVTPMELVFARRMTLTGSDGAIASVVAHAGEAHEVGCGSFTLRCATGSSLAPPCELVCTAPGRLSSDGICLIAVIGRLMPREPDPDPDLLHD